MPQAGHVDVWRVQLDEPEPTGPCVLSQDEVTRSQRFHFERDRVRFVRCRSALRDLLGRYMQIPAAQIRFGYQSAGKPEVLPEQNLGQVHFNVSHSGGLGLIAVGPEQPIGVDIEEIRLDIEAEALAERFFSNRERASLRAAPDGDRVPAFFACWTRKEALLKATGLGLSLPLSDFTVSICGGTDPETVEIAESLGTSKLWSVRNLMVEDSYKAALAVQSVSLTVSTLAYVRFDQ